MAERVAGALCGGVVGGEQAGDQERLRQAVGADRIAALEVGISCRLEGENTIGDPAGQGESAGALHLQAGGIDGAVDDAEAGGGGGRIGEAGADQGNILIGAVG